ncbi:MAG: hypothetical protein WD823_08415 [Sulfuricaulis sp.]|uniref:hypothetical protein n=1 Tax=Sulfuricaulis sp. TaxID=2003553 RepID=UPI0034A188E6
MNRNHEWELKTMGERRPMNVKQILLGLVLAIGFAGIASEAVEAAGDKPPMKTGKPAADQSCKQFCASITIRKPDGSYCQNIVAVEKSGGFCECQCHDNYNPDKKRKKLK